MTIKFVTSKNSLSQILSVDPVEFAQIIDVSEEKFTVRFFFKISLNNVVIDPVDYKKVVISLLTTQQESVVAKVKSSKFNSNSSNTELTSNSISKLKLDRDFSKIRSVDTKISAQSAERINQTLKAIDYVKGNKKNADSVTTVSVYINDKIKDALNNPFRSVDLVIPESVNLDQGQRLTSIKLDPNRLLNDINTFFKTPTQFLTNQEDKSSFSNRVIDYFIHDNNAIPNNLLEGMTFYQKQEALNYLDTLEISADVDLPIKYKNSSLLAKFDLYKINTNQPEETVNTSLKLEKYFEAYNALFFDPILDVTTTNAGNFSLRKNIVAFSSSEEEKKKITSFNIYRKSINSYGLSSQYSLVSSLNVAKKNIQQGTSEFSGASEKSLDIIRVIPVTEKGESNIFSDVVIGEGFPGYVGLNLNFYANQTENNNVTLSLNNISIVTEVINFYRRNCTNSLYSEFELINIVNGSKTSRLSFSDNSVTPGHLYEYFVETLKDGKVIQTSRPSLVEVLRLSKGSSKTTINQLNVTKNSVSFSISTDGNKQQSNDVLKTAINASTGDITFQSNFDPNKTISGKTKDIKEYNDLYFHQITRIDTTTFEKVTFDLISDGAFSDDATSRRNNKITELVEGRTYLYQVVTFKRDPASSSKDFIQNGTNNGKKWFYRPYKWNNPKVLNTGILYADDIEGIPDIQKTELFTADPVRISGNTEVTVPVTSSDYSVSPRAEKFSRSLSKISWSIDPNFIYDCFVVTKVVNGKKNLLGKTNKTYIYHKLGEEDLGTVYYEVTPITNDYQIKSTYFTNSILVKEELSSKALRRV